MIRSQLAVLILMFVVTGEAMAKSEEVIDTGIPATLGHQSCWLDDTRLIIMQKTQPPHGEPETEGLYVLDVTKPRELVRLDLDPMPSNVQRELTKVRCQEQTIILYRFLSLPQVPELYTMTLESRPQLLSTLRGHLVNLKAQYILGNSARVVNDGGPLQGTFEGNDDCDVRYVRAGFRVLCWDSFLFRNWPLTTFVLSEYQWREYIKVRAEDGRPKHIPNPAKRLIRKDGQPVNYGLYLRDLNGQIVASLAEDPRFHAQTMYGASITADEQYLYAPCTERTRRTGERIAVCRYRLDGEAHEWEQIFRIDGLPQFKGGIPMTSVSNTGDIYFAADTPHWSIWRFEAHSGKLEQLTVHSREYLDQHPSVSPNGKWTLFVRSGKDGAKFMLLRGGAR